MKDELRYILAISEYGNLSAAAESLFISQPALSRYIARLEKTLGCSLFDRAIRPLSLTPEGQRYRDYLQGVEQLRTAMEADLDGLAQSEVESVRLGTTAWRSSTVLPDAIPEALRAYPDLHITIFEGSNSQLHSRLKAKKLDLAVMNSAQAGAGIRFEPVTTERIVLAGQAVKELASDQGAAVAPTVAPQRVKGILQNSRLLLLHPEHHMGAVCRDFLASIGVRQRRITNTHNIVTAVRLAAQGAGVAFAPEGAARASPYTPYVYIRHGGLTQTVGLAWSIDDQLLGGTAALANALQTQLLRSTGS